MIHFSCDCCGKDLHEADDLRYVVRMEISAVIDIFGSLEVEDDRDNLLELHEILERTEDAEDNSIGEDVYQHRRYDLCPVCFKRFSRNPFGQQSVNQLNFSQN